jgi:hypothetical protein
MEAVMIIEIRVPDEWSAGQTLAIRQLLQRAVLGAQPVICPVREDITPDQFDDIYTRVNDLIRDSGLAAPDQVA